MPAKLRNLKASASGRKKKEAKADPPADNEAESCKENNVVEVEEKKKKPVSKSASAASLVAQEPKSQPAEAAELKQEPPAVELAEISSNNKKTKSRSKLTASAPVTAAETADVKPPAGLDAVSTVAMSTTTIEAVETHTNGKTTTTTKTTKTTTKTITVKTKSASKIASSSRKVANGSTGSCSESSNSGASSTGSAVATNGLAAKGKKKLKSLDTSTFSNSFTSFFVNKKITDYFPVRKSTRKCKSDIEKEKRHQIEDAILNMKEEGLEVRNVDQKGRGIFATRAFKRGDFVCEYAGEMVSYQEAKEREERYAKDESIGCYMYFFEHKSKSYCIDATAETSRLGRLLNHSKLDGNCQTKLFEIDSRPYLILVAARDIESGEELTYDYGDRNKTAIECHPWLAQ